MWSFIDSGYAWDFLVVLGLHVLAALCAWASAKARRSAGFRGVVREWIVPSFAVSVIGLAVGVLAGSSREYATDLVVPVILMAFAGFGLWLHSRADSPNRLRILVLTAAFAFCVLIGTFSGWAMEEWDDGGDAEIRDQNVILELQRPAPTSPGLRPRA